MPIILPKGFKYVPNVIRESDESRIINQLQQLNWQSIKLFGQRAKRRVVHFGMNYDYERRTITLAEPPPAFVKDLILTSAFFLELPTEEIAEVLISEYPVLSGIGWHCDSPVFDKIVGISLASDGIIHFRHRKDHRLKLKMTLERRSLYILSDAIRWDWEHRIAPVKELRYSLTFRTLNQ